MSLPGMVESQVDDRELRARNAVPLHFQAPNRFIGAARCARLTFVTAGLDLI